MLATERRLCKAPLRDAQSGEVVASDAETMSDAMLRLQRTKEMVPVVKEKVGEAMWKRAVDRMQGVRIFPRPDGKVISRAYAKLYEIPPAAPLSSHRFSPRVRGTGRVCAVRLVRLCRGR